MKITVVSQLFYPEEFKVNDLVKELIKRGHQVTVLTGKPNYPSGNYAPGYRFWGINYEDYYGAKVIRVPLIRRASGGSVRLALNYMSFLVSAFLYVSTHKIECDGVICFGVSPATQLLPAIKIKKANNVKLTYWLQDLWPESVAVASSIKEGIVMNLLTKMMRYIYRKSDTILIKSNGFEQSVIEKGDFKDKINYAPDWAEDFYATTKANKSKYADVMPEGFKVMFAGNIGEAQDLGNIINAAILTKQHPNIKWVIVGDGRKKTWAEAKVSELGLMDTVVFLGRYPSTEMPHFFANADAMLVSLKREPIFALTVPAKVPTYLISGKPILTMIDGETNDIVNKAQCGLTSEAEDYKSLVENVIKMSAMSDIELKEMGNRSKTYYDRHFNKAHIVDTIIESIS